MPKANVPLLAFNRGEISPLALARVDIDRTRLSAETMLNWLPKSQGAMIPCPGLGYIGASKSNRAAAWIPFVAATTDTALIELTDSLMRVWIDDALLTRVSVSTSISNGSFATSASWTDASTNGGAPSYGGSGLVLTATSRGGLAKVTRQITVAGGDQNKEHALRVTIGRGPVTFRVGSSSGGDEYVSETTLRTGIHSLAFTPTGDFHLTFQSTAIRQSIVTSIAVEASGTVEITAPWPAASLGSVRWAQSADVVFLACYGYQQRRIERRGTGRSWSLVLYRSSDGPFSAARTATVKLKPGATYGNTTLTSDKPFFKSTHVGALFRLFHNSYAQEWKISNENEYTDVWRVTGVTTGNMNERDFTYTVAGTWVGTINLQRSIDSEDAGFGSVNRSAGGAARDITGNGSYGGQVEGTSADNAIAWFRAGFLPGNYTSGTATITLAYTRGGGYGICRVTGFTSSTSVSIEVLSDFKNTGYTDAWQEGLWSDLRGWPSEVSLYEGRLWWFGGTRTIGSVSDDYESFDQQNVTESGPIVRTIGSGPVDRVNFALALQRLIVGTAGSEISIRSSSFDEALTPDNANAKDCSTQGSARLPALRVDARGLFVQRSGTRLFELVYEVDANDYGSRDLMLLNPDIAASGIVAVAIQRQPDTRIHCVLGNGKVAILTYEPAQELFCWSRRDTDGVIESAVVLPGTDEDKVYYHVARTIGGSTVRYLERWSAESLTAGGAITNLADSYTTYTGAAATSIPVGAHLNGEDVVVWANGAALTDADGEPTLFTVSGGSITIPSAATNVTAGLPITGQYKSAKLAYAAAMGTALGQPKRVDHLGVILADAHNRGLRYGRDFDNLDPLPRIKPNGAEATADEIYSGFDGPAFEFDGTWDTDSRLCLEWRSPFPVKVLAAIVSVATHDKA